MNMRKSCRTETALSIVAGMMLYAGVASADAIVDSSDLFNLNNLSGLSGGHTGGGAPETISGPVHWDDVTDKPQTATRWPTWNEIQGKPEFEAMFLKVSESPVGDCPEGEWMKGIRSDGSIVCAAVPAGSGGGDGGVSDPPADPDPEPPGVGDGGPYGSDGSTYFADYEIGWGGCSGGPDYATPQGGMMRASFTSYGTYSYEVTEAQKDQIFTIVLKGAGGGARDDGCGGNGGGIVFNYSPGVTGTFDILVGQGGRAGRAFGGGGYYAGGASAIKFNDELLAIVGGGGSAGDGAILGANGGDGGSANLAGANGQNSGSTGGYGGGSGIGGGGGGGGLLGDPGSAGGSYGSNGSGNSTMRGEAVPEFMVSGGGAGYRSNSHGSGGGGYGGGGGGGSVGVHDGAGGGGGGFYNTAIPSTPLVIKGSRGNSKGNGEDGVALIFTGTTGW